MRVTFEKVEISGRKTWKDASGKRRSKTMKFWQTISQFNKNAAGEVKTRAEILKEITAERDAWLKEPEATHEYPITS